MSEYRPWKPGPDDLVIPFVFVPHGAPEPTEWMNEHPGWVKFPATVMLRPAGSDPTSAALGTTAVAGAGASGLGGAFGEAFTEFLVEELKKAAPALAAAEIALRPTPTASPDIDEVPLETRLRLRQAAEGYAVAPSLPALPGIAAPALDALPRGRSRRRSIASRGARPDARHAPSVPAAQSAGRAIGSDRISSGPQRWPQWRPANQLATGARGRPEGGSSCPGHIARRRLEGASPDKRRGGAQRPRTPRPGREGWVAN